jgi:phospholipase C/peptidoglycan hydrolase-like protein with peptidoglycan-binding domain
MAMAASAGLHLGAFGDEVAKLHQALAQRGCPISAQEVKRKFFGPGTREALLEFQKRQRLDATGTLDAKTAAALSAPPPPGVITPRPATLARAAPVVTGGRTSGTVLPAPTAAGITQVLPGGLAGGDFGNVAVSDGPLPVADPCAEPAPQDYAMDHQTLQIVGSIAANSAVEMMFGPANAGPGIVTVDMYQALPPAPGPAPAPQLARRAVRTVTGLGGTIGTVGTVGGVTPLDTGPGGGTGPTSTSLPQGAFRIELLSPFTGAVAIAVGTAPLPFTLPVPPPSRRPPTAPPSSGRPPFLDQDGPNWKLRITNTTTVPANGSVSVNFVGNRPILRKAFDLDALNHLICRVVTGSAPITMAFENRGSTTWLIVLPDRDMQRQFGVHEFDLGMLILDRRLESEPLKVKLVVNDGRLALKARIDFPYGATLLIENLVKGLIAKAIGSGLFSELANRLADEVANLLLGKSEAKIKTLSADIMFTMRDSSLSLFEGPANDTCDILVRPYIDLEGISPTLTMLVATLIEGFIGRAYDPNNPAYDKLAKLRDEAHTIQDALGHYLLGRDLPEITRQSAAAITLSFAGDRPQGPVLTTGDEGPPDAPLPDPGLLANIDHIVVLMMENRSFDHVLGHLSLPPLLGGRGRTDVNGLKGSEFNLLQDGTRAYVFPYTRAPATLFGYDPGHGFSDQKIQRGGQTLTLPGPSARSQSGDVDDDTLPKEVTVPAMGGFVLAYAQQIARLYSAEELNDRSRNYGSLATDIMGYHLSADLPMYSFLTENYLICDRWFAAHPGDTWPNRFITLTGNLAPKPPHDPHAGYPETGVPDAKDFTPVHVKNIFDHLDAGGVTWRYYEHDLCMLRLFADYTLGHPNIVQIDDPVQGLEAAAHAGTLPSIVFIDPDLTDVPAGNDDHPPTDIALGQRLIKRVYDAIANSPLWEKTLLIITYDEYGGFYDHVLPREVSDPQDLEYVSPMFNDPEFPEQAPPGQFHPVPVHFRGVRVPTFIVSPWVQKGGVSHLTFDHTSILKTIVTRFLHDNPPSLGERVSRANGLEQVLSAPRAGVGPGTGPGPGTGMVVARAVARAAAVSPKLALPAKAPVAIVPGRHTGDFRTLISAVRDRYGLKAAKSAP